MRHAKKRFYCNPIHFIAAGFGAGLSPIAPGTVGTLVAVPIYLFLQQLSLSSYLVFIVLVMGIGVWLCGTTARDLHKHDPCVIVWDEMVGFWITLFAAPTGWLWIFIGFVLFRLFDIIKPWPISFIDRNVPGGTGIMADDILAAIYAGTVLQVVSYLSRVW